MWLPFGVVAQRCYFLTGTGRLDVDVTVVEPPALRVAVPEKPYSPAGLRSVCAESSAIYAYKRT